jgi:hypothetical protein
MGKASDLPEMNADRCAKVTIDQCDRQFFLPQ